MADGANKANNPMGLIWLMGPIRLIILIIKNNKNQSI